MSEEAKIARRRLAKLVKLIRSDEESIESDAGRTFLANAVWCVADCIDNDRLDDLSISNEEAERILDEFPEDIGA